MGDRSPTKYPRYVISSSQSRQITFLISHFSLTSIQGASVEDKLNPVLRELTEEQKVELIEALLVDDLKKKDNDAAAQPEERYGRPRLPANQPEERYGGYRPSANQADERYGSFSYYTKY